MRHLALALLLAAAHAAAAGEPEKREYIYGAELMSEQEREQYRKDVSGASDARSREKVRTRHRERLQKRARDRGVTLDATGVVENKK